MKRTIALGLFAAGVIVVPGTAAQAAPGLEATHSLVAVADQALAAHGADARASAGDAFTAYSTKVDATGAAHVRYTRTYQGIKVYGGDVVVHTDATGAYAGTSNSLAAPLRVGT